MVYSFTDKICHDEYHLFLSSAAAVCNGCRLHSRILPTDGLCLSEEEGKEETSKQRKSDSLIEFFGMTMYNTNREKWFIEVFLVKNIENTKIFINRRDVGQ